MPLSKLALATCIALALSLVQPASANQISPAQAGEIAQRQTGGRVLAVKPADGGYQVKVLTPDGSVRYVFVPGR
ncbi:PepSY domain-containing protein [Thiocystis violacea]|uniref:PepSY domain-containing protein n=1 Tax=Thiocystis violacea TaxID=13725 RepID=UPI001F5B6803|nr:hypothetical protein [Thiocystis violacea]MBK1716830.1 hypothetical protein [Thiocystis violacea]